MRTAYALLGLAFVAILGGAILLSNRSAEKGSDLSDEGAILEGNGPTMALSLSSSAFEHNGVIPARFTCDGENVNPDLTIGGVPEGTISLVLILDDPDIPQSVKDGMGIDVFDHWVLFSIPPDTELIPPVGPAPGAEGKNSSGSIGYAGPCPPDGEHRYFFKLYALNTDLDFYEPPTRAQVEEAMEGHILEEAELIGRYERK